jgi:ubiquinone/menaquinone biosynthesis C-methylase UbiE
LDSPRKQANTVADQLFEEWQIYEKLLIHDYMDHRAFFNRLQAEILARFKRPVAILDLGCGDLTPVLPMLANIPLQRYVGIDESDVALTRAARRLQELHVPGRLVKGDLLQAMAELGESFDVILASFSLHHLADSKDKQRTLEAGRQLLTPDGLFALIDVFSAESEPRDRYLGRWVKHAETRYVELQDEEKEILFHHVHSRDFPVSLTTFEALGKLAGLGQFEVLLEDRERLNCLVTFSANEYSGQSA